MFDWAGKTLASSTGKGYSSKVVLAQTKLYDRKMFPVLLQLHVYLCQTSAGSASVDLIQCRGRTCI